MGSLLGQVISVKDFVVRLIVVRLIVVRLSEAHRTPPLRGGHGPEFCTSTP